MPTHAQNLLTTLALATLCACPGSVSTDLMPPDSEPPADDSPDLTEAQDASPDAPPPVIDDMSPPDMPPDMEPPRPVAPIDPNALAQDRLFQCDGAPASSPLRLRRMTKPEYTRARVSGRTYAPARNPLQPLGSNLYSTYDVEVSLDTATLDQFLGQGGVDIFTTFLENRRCITREAEIPDDACIDGFVREYLERRVLYRPATQTEVERLATLARRAFALEAQGQQDRDAVLEHIARAAWLMTRALYRSEIGGEPGPDGRRQLGPWELAHALSYALTDHAPGTHVDVPWSPVETPLYDDIRQAALDGSIQDPEVIRGLVTQHMVGVDGGTIPDDHSPTDLSPEMQAVTNSYYGTMRLADPWVGRTDLRADRWGYVRRARRAKYWMSEKTTRFFHEWLGTTNFGAIFKDTPEATSQFASDDRSLKSDIVDVWESGVVGTAFEGETWYTHQLEDMIARIVWEDEDVFRKLLTSKRFHVRSSVISRDRLAKTGVNFVYDIDTRVTQIDDTREARWQTLPARSGVFTHPVWLAAHGGNFENDPSAVHRGKWIREHLLCGIVPDVPITVDAQLDAETINESARSRIDQKTGAADCAGCHRLMNPLGYPFEIYNHAGFVRAEDHGGPPDGSSTLVVMPDPALEGLAVTSAVDMMAALADSREVKRCFVRQVFRFYAGRDETYADACALAQMEEAYDMSGGSMTRMVATLLSSDTLLYTHMPDEEASP